MEPEAANFFARLSCEQGEHIRRAFQSRIQQRGYAHAAGDDSLVEGLGESVALQVHEKERWLVEKSEGVARQARGQREGEQQHLIRADFRHGDILAQSDPLGGEQMRRNGFRCTGPDFQQQGVILEQYRLVEVQDRQQTQRVVDGYKPVVDGLEF